VTYVNLFDGQAEEYARFRPGYPDALFAHLAARVPSRRLAWDVGTGNGQAALRLADDFDRVVATDSSAIQISHAPAHPKVNYEVALAQDSGLATASCDLVAAASAVHWFDRPAFYREVERVLRPRGVIAVWCYRLPRSTGTYGDMLAAYFDSLEPHWPAPTRLVRDDYRTLDFPFVEEPSPRFTYEASWTPAQLLGYVSSWTAPQVYKQETGIDSLRRFADELERAGVRADEPRPLAIPICMRLGTKT
jgi:SAM-dependent methyltransferase